MEKLNTLRIHYQVVSFPSKSNNTINHRLKIYIFELVGNKKSIVKSKLSGKKKLEIKMLKARISGLVRYVIDNGFPELKEKKVKIRIVKGEDYWMAAIPGCILVDYSVRKIKSDKALTGLVAHEVSHLLFLSRQSFITYLIQSLLSHFLQSRETQEERMVDREIIKRGFGREYYAFLKYHDKRYEDITKQDGLTRKEVKNILNSQEKSKK